MPALARWAAVGRAAGGRLAAPLGAFAPRVGPALAGSYDETTSRALVNAILADMSTLSSAMAAAIHGGGGMLSANVGADATAALNALDTLIDLFRGVLGLAGAPRGPAARMSETQALRVLGLR